LVACISVAGCGVDESVGEGQLALSALVPQAGVYQAVDPRTNAAPPNGTCGMYFPEVMIAGASADGYDYGNAESDPSTFDHCTFTGHMAHCTPHGEGVVDLRPEGLDLVLTFRDLDGANFEWLSPTRYQETSAAQILCEGTLCDARARCTLNGRAVYELVP
jgi:hypothetical protein